MMMMRENYIQFKRKKNYDDDEEKLRVKFKD